MGVSVKLHREVIGKNGWMINPSAVEAISTSPVQRRLLL